MDETPSDVALDLVANTGDVVQAATSASVAAYVEDERVRATTPADDEPVETHPEPAPAGLDPDTGFDPLPPQ